MKEIEIRNRDVGAGGDAETNPNNTNNNSYRSAGMRALKLRPQWLGNNLATVDVISLPSCNNRVKPWMFINDSQTTRLMIMMC